MIRLAITGAGYISKIHAQAAESAPNVQVMAVVERYAKTAQPFVNQFRLNSHYSTIDDLVNAGGIDAIVIGTPNYLHCPQAISALEAGIHVMVEKPMAMNAQEAQKMLDASQKSGALLMVAHCWRFDPEVRWLRQQVNTGRFGQIIRTKGYGVHALWGPSGWFTERKLAGGGAMADVGIHALDTARFLLGDPLPLSVYARIGTYYTRYDVDDTGLMIVNWDNGAVSYIESGWWQPHTDGPEAATQLYGIKAFGQLFPTYVQEEAQREDSGFPYPRKDHMPLSLFNAQLAYFIQCIREHTPPNPGGLEGLINMKVIDAAYKSSQTGTVVRIE
jgi:predicted dehydrogenase